MGRSWVRKSEGEKREWGREGEVWGRRGEGKIEILIVG